MKYLIDSDWVADYLKGRPNAVTFLDGLYVSGLAISIVTYAEIYEGIYYGRDPRGNENAFLRLLEGVRVLGITRPVARKFAAVRGELRGRGQILSQPDLLIAATAIHRGLELVTRNRRHFERIGGLKLYEPS